ncbi:hypothetical protein [Flagellimonas iocasae]|uniref:Protein argonaute n=1 Tax=Flagellimonas iocasae TaxID=2055905 RepID=A0ABW4Y260_9FLAO
MAGLFLNFFEAEIEGQTFQLSKVPFSDYSTKESYLELQDEYPDFQFYRVRDEIFYWGKSGLTKVLPLNSEKESISLLSVPKIVSKILESCLMDALCRDERLEVIHKRYSHSWEVISPNNKLQGINGLSAHNCYTISPKYFKKEKKNILGFTISLRTKYVFTQDKQTLEANGFDTSGLRGDENSIHANKQAIKRYIDAMGKRQEFESFEKQNSNNASNYNNIQKFVGWLNKNILPEVKLPNEGKIKPLKAYNIPSAEFSFDVLRRPKRFFYAGQENTKNLTYYNQMVKEYKPASYEEISSNLKIGVICPTKYEGRTETFLKTLKDKLESELHVNEVVFNTVFVPDEKLDSYASVIYNDEVLETELVIVIVSEDQKTIPVPSSPYYYCKAKLIGNGIPTQQITIETINGANSFSLTNISLNIYAKIGGTAWTIEKEDKLKKEFIIGIGSTTLQDGKHVLGLAQIFDPDGRYLVGDCVPISTFENYKENLILFLEKIIKQEIESAAITGSDEFRLIFHIYKSASSEYELAAVKEVVNLFDNYTFKYALIHLAYGHNYRLFYSEGKSDLKRGIYLPLDDREALLTFVPNSNLPLKINLDWRSSFQDLQYLSQQVYWFSDLSHRTYMPSKRTVTLMYPSLMVSLTEKLKEVEGWDFDRLRHINEKLWFI